MNSEYKINIHASYCLSRRIEDLAQLIVGDIVDGNQIEVGRVTAYFIDVEAAVKKGHTPIMVFGLREETAGFFAALFQAAEPHYFKDTVVKIVGPVSNRNVLIIDRLEVKPRYRGQEIGNRALQRVMQYKGGGCDLVALKAFPLQLQNNLTAADRHKYRDLEQDPEKAFQKLRRYYRRVGFKLLRGSKIMLVNPVNM